MLVSGFKTNQKVAFTSCSQEWVGCRSGAEVTVTETEGSYSLLLYIPTLAGRGTPRLLWEVIDDSRGKTAMDNGLCNSLFTNSSGLL